MLGEPGARKDAGEERALPGGIPRPVEAAVAWVGLIVLSPLLLLGVAAIALTSGRPVLFRQERVGRGGRNFTILKLRTMRAPAGLASGVTASDDPRITAAGRILRRLKLDELPELWNVVRGDMALVGPRPEVPRYVDLESPRWREVLRARPGLTDPVTLRLLEEEKLLAQVEGDREQFYVQKLQPMKLDGYIEYLRGRSAGSDLLVLWRTFLGLVSRRLARSGGAPVG